MKTEKVFLLFLFSAAIAVRTFYVYETYGEKGDLSWEDADLYVHYGKEFAKGNFYPYSNETKEDLIVGPVIPLIYAMSYLIEPEGYWPFFMYNILLASGVVIILYFLGKRLLNKKLGYFMAFWGLLFYDYMRYTPTILKEPTICFFLALLILLAVLYWQGSKSYWIMVGIALSYSVLIHTDERYLAIFLIILLLPTISDNAFKINKTQAIHTLFLFVITLFLMIPWTIRNYKEYHEIVLLTPRTTAITSMFWGTNQSTINFEGDERAYELMEARKNKADSIAAIYGIKPQFHKGIESKWRAFVNYWQPTYFRPQFIQYGYRFQKWSLSHNIAGLLFYGIYLPFFILGIIRFIRKQNIFLIWLISIPLLHSIIHALLVWPLERYRMPINFIVVLIAMIFIFDFMDAKKKSIKE